MTDARRIDLNYGHFGEAVYHTKEGEWSFPRDTAEVPQYRILGEPRTLLPSQSPRLFDDRKHGASGSKRRVGQLVQAHPEFASTPELLEACDVSESQHEDFDPSISDQLAFGRALHPGHSRRSSQFVPVAAVVGGVGGELVRVIQLEPETLGWRDRGVSFELETTAFQTSIQGVWFGNGGRVRQLQFAVSDGSPSEWLAIRYDTTISILRVILQDEELPLQYNLLSIPTVGADFELRFELKHIASLPAQDRAPVAFTDIRFNPCNLSELAVLDQACRWYVWILRSVNKDRDTWKLEAGPSGNLLGNSATNATRPAQETLLFNGWGSVNWIGKGAGLLVCNRKSMVAFALRNPSQHFVALDLALYRPQDWLLDVKQDSDNTEHFFVVTSSRILWIHITLEHPEEIEQCSFSTKILLGWMHFCKPADVSLTTQVTSVDSRKLILLYSRIRNMKTVYISDLNKNEHKSRPSVCDPYSFPDFDNNGQAPLFYATLPARPVLLERSTGTGGGTTDEDGRQSSLTYFRSIQMNKDLSLQECLLCDMPRRKRAPQILSRRHTSRSLRKVQDDFLTPDGILLSKVKETWLDSLPSYGVQDVASKTKVDSMIIQTTEDRWTISLEWLRDRVDSSTSIPFDQACHILASKFTAKQESSSLGILSLEEVIDSEIMAGDIDGDSEALEDVLRTIETGMLVDERNSKDQLQNPLFRSRLAIPSLFPLRYVRHDSSITQTYDVLMASWIVPLPGTVPGRVRSRIERLIRGIAAQVHLASHGLGPRLIDEQVLQGPRTSSGEEKPTFTLSARDNEFSSATSRRSKGKSPVQASAERDAFHPSEHDDSIPFANLPTPEPTPSVQSQGSSSLANEREDSASQRLRTLASLTSQAPLPSAMVGILSHWSIGQNPEDYDWEAGRITFPTGGDSSEAYRMTQRKKQRTSARPSQQQIQHTVGALSQPMPIRLGGSQVEAPSNLQPSSQLEPTTMSQPLSGRFGSSRKLQRTKKPGFR
ncbi:MAG: hypothetical protein Q9222_000436 [Ikaeria aurantiellina]